ncbi:hypothetical protein HPB47_016597 [Ixodes persulcatus]|uniref:Uncharacterized protein n=1 Tax=Ixodes persulcatus TaxID=34615 RepID=A0AC60QQP1_IXOPE|nr:hypothetical protein HPB47_016597 [Ixodes persulcatus]
MSAHECWDNGKSKWKKTDSEKKRGTHATDSPASLPLDWGSIMEVPLLRHQPDACFREGGRAAALNKEEQCKKELHLLQVELRRYFPSRSNCTAVVEAKFDGEVMTTDPVPHTCSPNFNTELAWGVDRKGLHTHRLRRTPVKVECFAVERGTGKKESVGYVVLEIRSAQENVRGTKWLPLLSSRYSGTKPQIKIGLHLEPDTVPEAAPASAPTGSRSAEVRPQPVNVGLPPSRAAEAEAEDLTPRLNLSEGYFQIGRQGAENYVFTVTVSFAANLNQLIHRSERASASKSGPYHFRYHLLGQEVTTEPFGSLSEPKFQPERASLRIRSSAPTLRRFFKDHPTLKQTNLCGGGDGGVEKRVEAASHNAQRAAAAATERGGARAYHVTSGGSHRHQLQIRFAL